MSNVILSLEVINDSSINSGQKILFRTLDYHDLVMLYDDGSDVAVWTKAEEDIFDTFPNAQKTEFKFILIGFGKEYDVSDVYKVPEFVLSDKDNNRIIVNNFHVAVSERPDMSVGLVLPGNLFNNTITHIERNHCKVHVSIEYDEINSIRTMGIKQKSLTPQEQELLKKHDIQDINKIMSSSYCFFNE